MQLINFIKNYQKFDLIIIHSRVNTFYLSQFNSSFSIIYLFPKKELVYFITDDRYIEEAKEKIKDKLITIISTSDLEKDTVDKWLEANKVKNIVIEEDELNVNQYLNYQKRFKKQKIDLINLTDLRIIKSDEEIELIKKAVEITDKAFEKVLKIIKPGISEREIAAHLVFYQLELGADKISFEPIIAAGKNGAKPHHQSSDYKIKEGDFVTIDIGCIYQGYCSDMTRTIVVKKIIDNKMKEIYDLVLEGQKRATNLIKANILCKDVHNLVADFFKEKNYNQYFTHALGHGLGINVHETPYLSPYYEIKLEENMVITNEPGIYIPNLGGVRIEDDILVTKDKAIVLNKTTKELIVV